MNDAANRTGGRGSELVPCANRRAPGQQPEEELETGEPIESDDEQSHPQRIRARSTPFDGRSPQAASGEPTNGGGQMVLTTAKYMPAQPPEPPRRPGQNRRPARAEEQPESSLEGQVLSSGKWGGMLAMAVATIWFLAGLADDIIFFYPPVLFFVGLVSFMKGTLK